MKGLSVIIAAGAIALIASGASAAQNSQHRTGIHTQVRKAPQMSADAFGYAQRPAFQSIPYDRLQHPYESDSQGHQSYPNPDRVNVNGQFPY
jgi:hypothetical protein